MTTGPSTQPPGAADAPLSDGLDPITFEVIRHRLWAINDDQGRMAARMSASPTVFDAYDFNAALITADGRGLYTGVYIMHHGATQDEFVRRILATWDRREIREGDMFFTNDPWWGALHANDGILAMPIFHEGRLVAWSGVVMHDTDVGGPVPSSFVVGAKDRFGEAPLFPGLKLVENYVIRRDLERVLLRNSRTPNDNALNMRARVAALRMTARRIAELIDQYGLDVFLAAQEGIIDHVERVLRSRLREIPDGTWFAQGYLDHDGVSPAVYPICCRVTKRGSGLEFDMSGTAPQAPGAVNCARAAMEGAIVGIVLTFLCYDLPWSVGAVRNVLVVKSDVGTINNAAGAAAVSMASIMGTLSTQDVVCAAFGKLLTTSERHQSEAQAIWTPGINSGRVISTDSEGNLTIARMPDSFGGGGGARTFQDGVDSGGVMHSMGSRIADVEVLESRGCILQVYRKEVVDSGGPGRMRGGVSIEFAAFPHRPSTGGSFNSTASGVSAPAGRGLGGGWPGAAASNVILRGSDVVERMRSGRVPFDRREVLARTIDVREAKSLTDLASDDFLVSVSSGGAGIGDPLRRDPAAVARDVAQGHVSIEQARATYGVVLTGGEVDESATSLHRTLLNRDRLRHAQPLDAVSDTHCSAATVLHPINDSVEAVDMDGNRALRCRECHRALGGYFDDFKRAAVVRERPLTELTPLNDWCDTEHFVAREFLCPGCARSLALDVQQRHEPILEEGHLLPAPQ